MPVDDPVEVLEDKLTHMSNGIVIRWVQAHNDKAGRARVFTYVAVKVGKRWYTTATDANSVVDQYMDSGSLASLLISEAEINSLFFVLDTDWRPIT